MGKVTRQIVIGDNSDNTFELTVTIEISAIDALILNDRMNTCSGDEYECAWNNMCDAIERSCEHLPYGWYVIKED
jgi:hypothetical protein